MFREKKPVTVKLKKVALTLATSLVALIVCVPAWAQGNLGRISGVVTDQSGGVIVGAMGFAKFDRQNIDVVVGGELNVDATLSPGSQTQTVTVTEEAPTISTT